MGTKLNQSGAKVQQDLNFNENLFPVFSTEQIYHIYEIVRYEDKLYQCIQDVNSAGEWTGEENWREVNMNTKSLVKTYRPSWDEFEQHDLERLVIGDVVYVDKSILFVVEKDEYGLTFSGFNDEYKRNISVYYIRDSSSGQWSYGSEYFGSAKIDVEDIFSIPSQQIDKLKTGDTVVDTMANTCWKVVSISPNDELHLERIDTENVCVVEIVYLYNGQNHRWAYFETYSYYFNGLRIYRHHITVEGKDTNNNDVELYIDVYSTKDSAYEMTDTSLSSESKEIINIKPVVDEMGEPDNIIPYRVANYSNELYIYGYECINQQTTYKSVLHSKITYWNDDVDELTNDEE